MFVKSYFKLGWCSWGQEVIQYLSCGVGRPSKEPDYLKGTLPIALLAAPSQAMARSLALLLAEPDYSCKGVGVGLGWPRLGLQWFLINSSKPEETNILSFKKYDTFPSQTQHQREKRLFSWSVLSTWATSNMFQFTTCFYFKTCALLYCCCTMFMFQLDGREKGFFNLGSCNKISNESHSPKVLKLVK